MMSEPALTSLVEKCQSTMVKHKPAEKCCTATPVYFYIHFWIAWIWVLLLSMFAPLQFLLVLLLSWSSKYFLGQVNCSGQQFGYLQMIQTLDRHGTIRLMALKSSLSMSSVISSCSKKVVSRGSKNFSCKAALLMQWMAWEKKDGVPKRASSACPIRVPVRYAFEISTHSDSEKQFDFCAYLTVTDCALDSRMMIQHKYFLDTVYDMNFASDEILSVSAPFPDLQSSRPHSSTSRQLRVESSMRFALSIA